MISFHNPGLIDLNAATLLGVNVKTGDSPIGFFGSGLKFSTAVILRLGGQLRIRRGETVHTFHAEPVEICGEQFSIVYLDDTKLGFTTAMGPNWEPWMVFRELASNAKDESGGYCFGKYQSGMGALLGNTDQTIIEVEGIDEIWAERDTILLSSKPLYQLPSIDVHPSPSKYIYYRGIRVGELKTPSHFTYNIKGDIILTEDRTLKAYYLPYQIVGNAIASLDNEAFTRAALYASSAKDFESKIDWDWCSLTDLFHTFLQDNGCGYNEQLKRLNMEWKLNQTSELQSLTLSPRQQSMYDNAHEVLLSAGIIERQSTQFVKSLARNVTGLVKESTCYIAENAFSSTVNVAHVILANAISLQTRVTADDLRFSTALIEKILELAQDKTGRGL